MTRKTTPIQDKKREKQLQYRTRIIKNNSNTGHESRKTTPIQDKKQEKQLQYRTRKTTPIKDKKNNSNTG